jgi:metallo-beta-lactamase family protein
MVSLRFTGNGRESSLLFTGDLGRPNMPILRNPAPLPEADLVVSESTYGGQKHDPIDRMAESLRVLIRQTVDRGGKVLIPAFSLGRTQVVVHTLQELRQRGHLPEVPIYVDSPLAGDIAAVFRRHPECLSEQGVKELAGPVNFLEGHLLSYVKTVDESKQINARKEPCIIVASSGMGEGGRILHHLKHNVDDPRSTVILVSYQAKETLGWRLLEHKPTVRFLGREWNKWANVVSLKGFSSHADHQDIVNSLAPLAGKVAKLRFVHGEVEASAKLAKEMRTLGFADVAIPQQGDTLNFGENGRA